MDETARKEYELTLKLVKILKEKNKMLTELDELKRKKRIIIKKENYIKVIKIYYAETIIKKEKIINYNDEEEIFNLGYHLLTGTMKIESKEILEYKKVIINTWRLVTI